MRKILMIALIASSIVACKNKKDDPAPDSGASNVNLSQLVRKDTAGNFLDGMKFYYDSKNQLIKKSFIDSLGKEMTNSYISYVYNSDGNIITINNHQSDTEVYVTNYIFTNGLITKEISSSLNNGGDTTEYVYNSDKTLKYYVTKYDSVVYDNYSNGKPQTSTTYSSNAIKHTKYYTFDADARLIKTEIKYPSSGKMVTLEQTYSNTIFNLTNLGSNPIEQIENSNYIQLSIKRYNINEKSQNILYFDEVMSNFKYDTSNRLSSVYNVDYYYNEDTGVLENTRKYTVYYTH